MLFAAISALAIAATTPQNHVAKAASLELWARHAKEQKLAAIATKDRVIAHTAELMAMGSGESESGFDEHGTYSYTGSYKDLMKVCGRCTASMEEAEEAYYAATKAHKAAEDAMTANFSAYEAFDEASDAAYMAKTTFHSKRHELVADFKVGTTIVESFGVDSDAVSVGKKLDLLDLCEQFGPLVDSQKALTAKNEAVSAAKSAYEEAARAAEEAVEAAEEAETKATELHSEAKHACGQMKAAEARIKKINEANMEMQTAMATA